MPINLTAYNKLVVNGEVVHEGTPPEDPLTKLHRELLLAQEATGPVVEQIKRPLKASIYKQDMVTSKK